MKIMILGANGQLGGDLVQLIKERHPEHLAIPITHKDVEATDTAQVKKALDTYSPDIVINTTAYHKVDEVESYPEKAFAVNAIAPLRMAQLCQQMNIAMLFISTDYVFGGNLTRSNPYDENDPPAPLNVYGASKLAGEYLMRTTLEKHFVVRTSGLYGLRGASGKGGNFVELMLRLAAEGKDIRVVNDQRLTPTYTMELARALISLVESQRYGLYHLTCSGDCTWYEFAAKIFELSSLQPNLSSTTSQEFKTLAVRPAYSVLAKNSIRNNLGIELKPWQEALLDYLQARHAIVEKNNHGGFL